ncbi:MAG TPA: hypothetical protein VFL42_00015 [Terriglobales bacterium]|nr:hypothetical protein [Terriglobales bacterium]
MSIRKVYGGTPVGNESRCDTCSHARIIQGYAESERIVICVGPFDQVRVPFKVMSCTMYDDKRLPDYEQLRQIAWDVRAMSAGARAGFVLASEIEEHPKPEQGEDQESAELPSVAAKTG